MKTAVLTFICLSILCAASGQTDQTLDRTARDYIRNHTDRMAEDLELDDAQRERLFQQNSAHYLHETTVHDAENTSGEMPSAIQEALRKYDGDLQKILNREQYNRYEERKENYRLEYPRDRRASPTRAGSPSTPRHGN